VKQIRGPSIPSTLEELCEPRRTALLIYDMQIGICRQIRDSDRIVERCAVALAAARRAGMAWQRTADPEAVKSWFLREAPASEVVPELRPSADRFATRLTRSRSFADEWNTCNDRCRVCRM
jgi:nicotinamidase-related amidase